ncbi:MAG: tetratricopeptide repeat protein [Candidatus Gastranaerophilales bacterium]|nr:tetratricopeptide repeat protein [Candidatus Gastranaerophilales bacterium]
MRKILSVLITLSFIVALVLNQNMPANAAKKATKKKGMNQELLKEINDGVNILTKKIYERELYTPEDLNKLIDLKIKVDDQMDITPDPALAPIYYKLGNIFKMRGQEKEAIVCYQTILENFLDTAYGPKSRDTLAQMGIEVKLPEVAETEEF